MKLNSSIIAGFILGAFGLIGSTLVALTESSTREQITINKREALLERLREIMPQSMIDNDLLAVTLETPEDMPILSDRSRLYFGTLNGDLQAIIYAVRVPNGYSGPINLLVAINADNRIVGARVVSHTETPGLGDKVELAKSDWILGFDGKSLQNPAPAGWKVKKDGGEFDQFTGATITPRAIVAAIKATLEYHQQHRDALFERYQATNGQETAP